MSHGYDRRRMARTEVLEYTDATAFGHESPVKLRVRVLGPVVANELSLNELPVGAYVKSVGELNWLAHKLGPDRWEVYGVNRYGPRMGGWVDRHASASRALSLMVSKLERIEPV